MKLLSELLRERVSQWLTPLAARIPMAPNTLTALGVAAAAGAGLCFGTGHFILASVLVAASGAFDILDGCVARTHSPPGSGRGAFLDSAADRIGENLILCGIAIYYATHSLGDVSASMSAFIAASTSNLASYVKCRIEAAGIPCNVGIFRRQERLVALIIGGMLGPSFLPSVLLTLAAFAIESLSRRFVLAYRRIP